MIDIFDIIKEFEGIFGVLLGVIVTMVSTELIKRWGKIYTYFDNWNASLYKQNKYGESIGIDFVDYEESDYYKYEFDLQIFNSSQIYKALRDIRIEFVFDNKSIFDIPNNNVTSRQVAFGIISDEIKSINLIPMQILDYKLSGYIKEDRINMGDFRTLKKIYFHSKNHKGKKVRELIKEFK